MSKRVGNRTNHRPETADKIKAMTKAFNIELEEYKRFTAARRANRKYTQEKAAGMWQELCEYYTECKRTGQPLTVADTMLRLGVNKDFWSKAKAGEYDFLLEEFIALNNVSPEDVELIDGLPYARNVQGMQEDEEDLDDLDGLDGLVLLIPFSEIVEKAGLMIQAQLERNCYTNKGNPAGSIFGLKAQFDWKEDATPQHLVQQLVIADKEQAKKALDLLK